MTVANSNSSYAQIEQKGIYIPHTGSFKLEVRKIFVTASVILFGIHRTLSQSAEVNKPLVGIATDTGR